MKKVISIGEALIDFIPNQKGCELKDVIGFERVAGGAPANVSAVVAKLGGKSNFISKLGRDAFGDHIIEVLKEANVNTELIEDIIEKMEQNRIKAYQFKRQYVLDEFASLCQEYGMNIVNQGLFLRCDTTHECFYPLTRIPSCTDLYNLKVMFDKIPLFSTYAKKIIYNGSYCRPGIESYLQWLNMQLPVTSYNITK